MVGKMMNASAASVCSEERQAQCAPIVAVHGHDLAASSAATAASASALAGSTGGSTGTVFSPRQTHSG